MFDLFRNICSRRWCIATPLLCLFISLLVGSCQSKPKKVDVLREEKRVKDSVALARAQMSVAYADSLLPCLQQEADSLLKLFRYEKNEQWEDHGRYVHRLLQTSQNTQRNYLQPVLQDNGVLSMQSFYYGSRAIEHHTVKLSAGEVWVAKEGSNHTFEAEGIHEIVTIQGDDALQLLRFIAEYQHDRVLVTLQGKQKATYYLQKNEKQALTDTYHLALVMHDILTLEQNVKVSNRQIEALKLRRDGRNNL